MSDQPRVMRPTVSLLVPTTHPQNGVRDPNYVLGIKFRTKRNRGYGIPGGGKEMNQTLLETAVDEGKQELGIDLDPTQLTLFAVRDKPDRDSNPGKPLSKYVKGSGVPELTVTAEHCLDFVFLYGGPAVAAEDLSPVDTKEVEAILRFDVRNPPDPLPISDDRRLLNELAAWNAAADKSSLPIWIH